MLILSISDLHLGRGKFLNNGQANILEDFDEDERFMEFCEYYSSGTNYLSEIHLVLNGDIFNLIQIDIDGSFTNFLDEEVSIKSLERIAHGHELFFKGLEKFLSSPNKKVTYIIGNHDANMAFKGVQDYFRTLVKGEVQFAHNINIHGVHIEHGHRFEVVNTVPPKEYFLKGPKGRDIINLPWGSLFCINVLPNLKKHRPFIDRVRPVSAYIKWCILHDLPFFLYMSKTISSYIIKSNFKNYTKQNRNFKTTIKLLKQITIYPKYAKMAKRILKKNTNIHTVIMGHTHVEEWRRFPEGKYYFNTGTWNLIPSIDASLHQNQPHLTYCAVDINKKSEIVKKASLNKWHGRWRPYREEVATT